MRSGQRKHRRHSGAHDTGIRLGGGTGRLFRSELRHRTGQVAGAALACALTAAGAGACALLLLGAGLTVRPPGSPAAEADEGVRQLLSMLLSLLLMCAVLVIGSTVSLWTGQRLGQFAVLRALGVTAGRTRLMVALDVARLAVLSAAAGSALAMVPLAYAGRGLLVAQQLLPAGTGLPGPALTALTGLGVCLATAAVAVLAALLSVLAAGRGAPVGLLKTSGPPPVRSRARLVTGLVMVALLVLPLLVVMALPGFPATVRAAMAPGVALMVVPTLAVLAPWLVPALTRPVCTALRVVDRRVGRIAAAGLRAAPARTTAMAVPVLLAVGVAGALLGAGTTVDRAVRDQTGAGLLADAMVTAGPGTRLPASPGRHPGVTAVPLLAAKVTTPPGAYDSKPGPVRAWGVDGPALARVVDLGVTRGSISALRPGTFAAAAELADEHHWALGSSVRLKLPDGTARPVRLTAIYERGLAFPRLMIPRATALAHTKAPYADRIALSGSPDAWPAAPGQKVLPRAAYVADFARNPADNLGIRLTVAVICGYSLLAAANTGALAQRDRAAQRAHLRALGLGRFQMLRCVLYEALGAGAVGLALAAAVALSCLIPLSATLGTGVLPSFDAPWILGVLATATLAITLPAAATARPFAAMHRHFARRSV
ncbi:FtsX-like permease family protein [Streptomyces sp. MST-110588]|uniref:FtsX-like permease family protein n=1 Tax=Streptomyces sp. MST-110588 TaxID=2833628 RepID=UPI001F5C4110|nr:FtsX-like permease family protein [Streptomyces sp. MST-110588]UNO41582.1 hypothetical protein KGS77_21005 [Streptomyces sp. MST-110588]